MDTTTPVPVQPATATSAQVVAHHTAVTAIVTDLEKGAVSVDTAEKYLDAKAAQLATWVSSKHSKTRLLEVGAIFITVGGVIGFFIGRI